MRLEATLAIELKHELKWKRFWRVKHDIETKKGWWRKAPEVFWCNELVTPFGADWQLLSYALNPGMNPKRWRAVYQHDKAFCNGNGFDWDGHPRADFVNRLDLSAPLPAWDKTRFCGGALLSGEPDGRDLVVEILDGRQTAPTLEWLLAHYWLWFEATDAATPTRVDPFPQRDGLPVRVPLVGHGEARFPLSELEEIPANSVRPDPYRIYHLYQGE